MYIHLIISLVHEKRENKGFFFYSLRSCFVYSFHFRFEFCCGSYTIFASIFAKKSNFVNFYLVKKGNYTQICLIVSENPWKMGCRVVHDGRRPSIASEADLICRRVGLFTTNPSMTVCPYHRFRLGLGFRQGKTCVHPLHAGTGKTFRGISSMLSQCSVIELILVWLIVWNELTKGSHFVSETAWDATFYLQHFWTHHGVSLL